jgi:L-threonylcarbamoyladenylate synthase
MLFEARLKYGAELMSLRFLRTARTASPTTRRNLTKATRPFVATMNGHADKSPDFEQGWPEERYSLQILQAQPARVTFPKPESAERQEPVIEDANEETSETSSAIYQAAAHLRAGNLVALPTETVYGLGANARNPQAVAKIFRTKGRPSDNPLIVHVSDMDMLNESIPEETDDWRIPEAYRCLMKQFWPGSMTLLFPTRRRNSSRESSTFADEVTCGLSTVGIRMPSHPVARALIRKAGVPVAAPSSNASGRPSPTTAEHVQYDLGGALDEELAREKGEEPVQGPNRARISLILDGGPCQVGLESTVIDGVTDAKEIRILRPGGVTVEDIRKALQERELEGEGDGKVKVRVYGKDLERSEKEESKPSTPGMKYKHYSPSAKVVLLHLPDSSSGRKLSLREILQQQLMMLPQDAERTPRIGLMAPSNSPLINIAKAVASDAMKLNARGSGPAETLSLSLDGTSATLFLYDLGPTFEPKTIASRLFAGLRQLDEDPLATPAVSSSGGRKENGCDVILVQAMSMDSIGLAFMNRLEKAASEVICVDANA